MGDKVLLKVSGVSKQYRHYKSLLDVRRSIIKAVDGVSFEIFENEIFSVVGETGCGKSTLSRLIAGLTDRSSGSIYYKGEPLDYKDKRLGLRKKIQVVFQDPYSSLNPKKRIYKIITYPALKNGIIGKKDRKNFANSLLNDVGLDKNVLESFPHELSGGQRQRVGIARSLSVSPELLILDEPVSALDVSISAQVLNLLAELHEKEKITYMFITHDLNLVRHMADRVMVMYAGKIMEISTVHDFFEGPAHPYSKSLLQSLGKVRQAVPFQNPVKETGCVYYSRCNSADECCKKEPPLIPAGGTRIVSCYYPEQRKTVNRS